MRTRLLAALLALAPMGAFAAEFEPCEVHSSSGITRIYADCTTISQPENPNDADSRSIHLKVAKIPTGAAQPATDAIVLINGGPGGSSLEMLADFSAAFTVLGAERDIIAMDQRGTGASNRLACSDLFEEGTSEFDAEVIASASAACHASLDADTRFYTTSVAVQDLEALREQLGYEQWTIYGVSYGTRVALHYLRRYPGRVRALIIDGVLPPDEVLGAGAVFYSQAALNALNARCQQSAYCATAFDDLSAQLKTLRDRLATPVEVTLPHPITGATTTTEISYGHVVGAVRFALYAPESAAVIPATLRAAVEGNYLPIAAQALTTLERLSTSMANAMHNSVVCTEDTPYFGVAEANEERLNATYMTADFVKALKAICSAWPEGSMDEDFHDPVISDVPVLLLSGEFDPITPPEYADRVLKNLSNAKHIVVPGQGHGVIARGCVAQLVSEFVETPQPDEIDATCTDHLKPMAFFVDSLGPPP